MKKPPPMYRYRSDGPILKIAAAGNGYWRLFVDTFGGDVFEDEREAVSAAAEKRSGFSEWDDTPFACPEDLNEWERI